MKNIEKNKKKLDLKEKNNKKYKYISLILLFALCIYYFMIPMSIFWDTGHYTSYVSIFEGELPWNSWDIVRGIVFPMMLHISNLIFGKTTQGVLILSFIFYLAMLLGVKAILDNCLKVEKPKIKKILYVIVFGYLIIDPLVYGYYHALLTEFIAMTVSIIMCFLSWKWIELDFFKDRKKYIIYSILFIFATIYSWHLKQPYVSAALFPVVIATIISIASNRKLKNIIQRLSTTLLCVIGLILSISLWNSFLVSKGIDLNSGRNVTSSFGRMLIDGLNNYKVEENPTQLNYLSKSEKEKIANNNQYLLINVNKRNGKTIDQDIIKIDENGFVSTSSAIKYIISQMFKHPDLVLDSYASTYFAIIDVYPKTTENGVTYGLDKRFDFSFCHENCTIGLKVLNQTSNIMYMNPDAYARVSSYEQYNNSPIYLRGFMRSVSRVTLNIFRIVFLLLPILCISSTISIVKKKNKEHISILSIILIMFWYSLLHILVHVSTGANIDRYASPAYITTILALFLYIYYFIALKKVIRRKKKNER